AAAPTQQAALLECYARVGDAAAGPNLLAIAREKGRAPGLRVAAARSLIEVDAGSGIPVVASLLQEASPLPDLYLLVHLLAGTGKVEAIPVLAAALQQNGDRSVRCHAATGLGNFKGTASIEALAAAATADEYPAVRTNALRALARVAPAERLREVAERLATSDPDPALRAVARELAPAGTGR
ncbi:MAG: HEAT repeat domain-containing protein, partial [Planctomycetota bacterium]